MRKLVIILDPAHGIEVPGKRSPDGKHREYLWSRNICGKLYRRLLDLGFKVYYSNGNSEREVGLKKRANFATNLEVQEGERKFLLSLHNNAAGDGSKWEKATGYEIYTSKGKTKSDNYAEVIMTFLGKTFDQTNFKVRPGDGQVAKEAQFTVLTGKGYYACLLEWLFQDNVLDVKKLSDPIVNERLVSALVGAMLYLDSNLP